LLPSLKQSDFFLASFFLEGGGSGSGSKAKANTKVAADRVADALAKWDSIRDSRLPG